MTAALQTQNSQNRSPKRRVQRPAAAPTLYHRVSGLHNCRHAADDSNGVIGEFAAGRHPIRQSSQRTAATPRSLYVSQPWSPARARGGGQ